MSIEFCYFFPKIRKKSSWLAVPMCTLPALSLKISGLWRTWKTMSPVTTLTEFLSSLFGALWGTTVSLLTSMPTRWFAWPSRCSSSVTSGRVGKNPGFFKKTQPSGFFCFFFGFLGFFWGFWGFLAQTRGFLGFFFQFHEYF